MSKDVLTDALCMRAVGSQIGAQSDTAPRAESATDARRPLKVCVVGLKCYDHMAGSPVLRYIGGVETQLALLAKGLQREGCEVSLITYDHGQADQQVLEGVNVLKSYSLTGGIPKLRWLFRAAKLWRAMKIADADVYVQMGAGDETGMVAMGCRAKFFPHRRFVYCMASDLDCHRPLGAKQWDAQTMIYLLGLKLADLIISQTKTQQTKLQATRGYSSIISQMAAKATEGPCGGPACADQVLWIGRISPEKRPHLVLEMARRCPKITFHMAGANNSSSEYAAKVLADAKELPNVRMHGSQTRTQLNDWFRKCSLLCCTSEIEGFPTTFLEAWSCGMPIVTTFDPDGVIARHGLGRVVKTVEEMVAEIESLPNSSTYGGMSNACRNYYTENQTVEAVSRRFHRAFRDLVQLT